MGFSSNWLPALGLQPVLLSSVMRFDSTGNRLRCDTEFKDAVASKNFSASSKCVCACKLKKQYVISE